MKSPKDPGTITISRSQNPIRILALICAAIAALLLAGISTARADSAHRTALADGWRLQSSAHITASGTLNTNATGETISTTAFDADADLWYPATVPSTVVGTLVDDGLYSEPFYGTNLRSMPGMDYSIGSNFSGKKMADNSPFKGSWWWRREFKPTPGTNGQVWLDFDGINYRASIWLNGKMIADDTHVAGAYRTYEFNVTDSILPGKTNVLAVQVYPPEPNNLAITWVDWNPAPPDKDMGLWRDVFVSTTGPIALRHPQVITKVDMPSLDKAHLIVSADVINASSNAVKAVLTGTIENIEFHQAVDLAPGETKNITFTPDQFPQLNVDNPRLWWPSHVGPQNLYDLRLAVTADGVASDDDLIHFGIREATSELDAKGYRVFKINGKPILVRGGGWAPDMFLRPSPEREAAEIRYVKDMNLNAIRFEGKTERGPFLDMCDREGIMVIAGWCCCDFWERWSRWKDGDYDIATESLRDQVWRIRNHPCLLTYWYGSDNPPNARAESNYLAVLKELNWPNSAQASASAKQPAVGQPTGIRMTGPYEYVPPVYWYVDTNAGGAYCFNTETSPGPAIPPIESLRRMLPKEHLWPIDDVWGYHAGGGPFRSLKIFTDALDNRLGTATNAEDYAQKAQVMAYDGERAMFEAYARNKYDSTGVIQWMMNNSWPSMIWHLFDWYLRPGGGYFGVKKACEPVHIQYSYDDASIAVVNSYYQDFKNLKASATVYNLDGSQVWSHKAALDLPADGSVRAFTLPDPSASGFSPVYFVKLTLDDSSGKRLSSNFYWLSTKPDTLGEPKDGSDWYYTPTKQYADFTALNTLPPVELNVSATSRSRGADEVTEVRLNNPGNALAFFVRLKVNQSKSGDEMLPVIWQDNYVSLLPGEERTITATYSRDLLNGDAPVVEVSGWNVKPATVPSQ
jgi:exo-1,4-beta-D-glucosaminidase